MRNLCVIFYISFLLFSCEETSNIISDVSSTISLETINTVISQNDILMIRIQAKNLPSNVFGAYFEIEIDTSKIEFIDFIENNTDDFWIYNSITFHRFENGMLHYTIVGTENQEIGKTEGKAGELSIRALSVGSTTLKFNIQNCEFYDSLGESIFIDNLLFKSLNININ